MTPEPSLGGYFLYLLEIFLPGIGFGELFHLWKKEDSLIDRVGLAFGLGLSFDTIVLMVRTSGIARLSGIDVYTLYVIMMAGVIALAISLIFREKKFGIPKFERTDLILIVLLIVQSLVLLLYFQKYPIFPEYQSQDYGIHVQLAEGLISGSMTSIPSGILYYGIHYQLASGILFVGGEPLITVRETMAILVVLSSLLFYSSTKRVFSSSRIGLICTLIYVLSGYYLVCERFRFRSVCQFLRNTCGSLPIDYAYRRNSEFGIFFSVDNFSDCCNQRILFTLHSFDNIAGDYSFASFATSSDKEIQIINSELLGSCPNYHCSCPSSSRSFPVPGVQNTFACFFGRGSVERKYFPIKCACARAGFGLSQLLRSLTIML